MTIYKPQTTQVNGTISATSLYKSFLTWNIWNIFPFGLVHRIR